MAVLDRNNEATSKPCENLETELKHEINSIPKNTVAIEMSTPNPYGKWECAFAYSGKLDNPEEFTKPNLDTVPSTKARFIEAIQDEIAVIGNLQSGYVAYVKAINSGSHQAFSDDFLKGQTDACHKTIGQLFQIAKDLKHMMKEVEAIEDDSHNVKIEYREVFGYARPWVRRTRAVLVSCHVFYKINYVLGSDKSKNFH